MNPDAIENSSTMSLTAKLFSRRIHLLSDLDARTGAGAVHSESTLALRAAIAELLRAQVAGMSLESFEVRPHRRKVEQYSVPEAFAHIDVEQASDLSTLAILPTAVTDSDGPAKVFDHLILRMQLAMLRAETAFVKMAEKVVALAARLSKWESPFSEPASVRGPCDYLSLSSWLCRSGTTLRLSLYGLTPSWGWQDCSQMEKASQMISILASIRRRRILKDAT
jgi:type I site-specific restriction endonuclease